MTFDLTQGTSRVWRYWTLPDLAISSARTPENSEEALVDRLETLLEDAVSRQMVADVPIGILLSGGVDSSLVTAMAVRAAPNVKTFTVRFPGYVRFDETEYARLISRHFGTTHLELDAGHASVDTLPLLARQFDEPMVDSSMIPTYLVSKLVREHCTVALGGDGGDELFGGYALHSRLLWTANLVRYVPSSLRHSISGAATTLLPVGFKGRVWLQGLETDFRHSLPVGVGHFDSPTRKRLLNTPGMWASSFDRTREERIPKSSDLLQRVTRMDFENYLPEDILVKVDRASMLNSLEVRAPLLDYRLIEFAFGSVPSSLKTTKTSRKVLLRRLATRLFPSTFDQRRKQGFSIPLVTWLRGGPWKAFFHEVLLRSDGSIFDRQTITELLAGAAHGRANGERLFALVMFELWRREYNVAA